MMREAPFAVKPKSSSLGSTSRWMLPMHEGVNTSVTNSIIIWFVSMKSSTSFWMIVGSAMIGGA